MLVLTTLSPLTAITYIDPLDLPGSSWEAYEALAQNYTSVGQINASSIGSGVLIAPNWVLSAAHLTVFGVGDNNFRINGGTYTIAEVIWAPDFSLKREVNDLALYRLTTDVVDAAVQPATMFAFPDANDIIGEVGTWVGLGQTGTGRTGNGGPVGQKLAMNNIVDGFGDLIDASPATFVSDFDSPDGKNDLLGFGAYPVALEGNVAPGDSGGGVFMNVGGRDYLVGITVYRGSEDGANDSDYGDVSGATVLREYADWITETSGIGVVPEPGASALLAGLAAIAGTLALRSSRKGRDGR